MAGEGAAKFEDQLRTINTVAKLPDATLHKLGEDILALSQTSGKSTDDLTAGFYDLVSAGVPADQAMKVLRDSATLATGALGTTGEAVDLVTSSLGAYNLGAEQSTRVTDIWAQAVADGKTTVADLAGGISQVAPIAAAAGVSLEEVAAQTAIMTLKGDTASQAMTRVKQAISALLTPNAELAAISKKVGINFADLAKQQGLGVALEALRKATNGNDEAFARALGSSEALTLGLSVTGDNAAAAATELGKVKTAADQGGVALGQAGEKMKSPVEQGNQLKATIHALAIEIGDQLGPTLPLISAFGPLLSRAFAGGIVAVGGFVAGKLLPALLRGLPAAITAGTTLGTATGVAEGEAQAVAVSSPGIVTKFVASILAFSLPGATAGTTVGTVVGGAIAAGAVAFLGTLGLVALSLALKELLHNVEQTIGSSSVTDSFSAENQMARWKKAGAEVGQATADSWEARFAAATQQWEFVALFKERAGAAAAAEAGVVGTSAADAFRAALDQVAAQIPKRTAQINAAMTALVHGGIVHPLTLAGIEVLQKGLQVPLQTAQGIRNGHKAIEQAMLSMKYQITHPINAAAEHAFLLGQLHDTNLIRGLHSKDPSIRAQAQATSQLILDQMAALIRQSIQNGQHVASGFLAGIKPGLAAAAAYAAYIAYLIRRSLASAASAVGGVHGGYVPRAGGGPVWPGQEFRVGEHGPERLRIGLGGLGMVEPEHGSWKDRLRMPDLSSSLAPMRQSMAAAAGGGFGGSLTVHVHTPFPLSPGHGQALAKETAPHIWRELQRIGKIGDD